MKLTWEQLPEQRLYDDGYLGQSDITVQRSKVLGGWLVWAFRGCADGSIAFFPDPEHKWDGGSLQ